MRSQNDKGFHKNTQISKFSIPLENLYLRKSSPESNKIGKIIDIRIKPGIHFLKIIFIFYSNIMLKNNLGLMD